MSSDKVTTEVRRGIHKRGRSIGNLEGVRSGVNQLASFIGPKIGETSLHALGIVLDADGRELSQKVRFDKVDWQKLGAATLDDLYLLTPEELSATQSDPRDGEVFADSVRSALKFFNIPPNPQ